MKALAALLLLTVISGCASLQLTAKDVSCSRGKPLIAKVSAVPPDIKPTAAITADNIARGISSEPSAKLRAPWVEAFHNESAFSTFSPSVKALLTSLREDSVGLASLRNGNEVPRTAIHAAVDARVVINQIRTATWPLLWIGSGQAGSPTLKLTRKSYPSPSAIVNVADANGFAILVANDVGVLQRYGHAAPPGRAALSESEVRAELVEVRLAKFLHVYLDAYLRHGHIFQVSANVSDIAGNVATNVADALKLPATLTPAQIKQVKDAVKNKLQGKLSKALQSVCHPGASKAAGSSSDCLLTNALGNAKFISRAGLGVQFAGITASVGSNGSLKPTLNYPPATNFAPQIMRVAMEAAADAIPGGPPAVATATACNEPSSGHLFPPSECMSNATKKTIRDEATAAYGDADKVEAMATAIAAQWVRGISVVALNNEALANAFETAFGVAARKAAERLSWNIRESKCIAPRLVGIPITVTQ